MQNMSKMCCCRHFSEDWIRKVDRINLKVAQEKKTVYSNDPKSFKKETKTRKINVMEW